MSYPAIDEADRRWIEAIRVRHDPRADRIAAHFTLVFPMDAAPRDVALEVAAVARSAAPIAFVIRRALAVLDVAGGSGHVFLVPDEGADAIAALHDRLYGGTLRPHLRADTPFQPHITVAADRDVGRCEAVALDIGRMHRVVRGRLEHVDLLDLTAAAVSSIKRFALGRGRTQRPSTARC